MRVRKIKIKKWALILKKCDGGLEKITTTLKTPTDILIKGKLLILISDENKSERVIKIAQLFLIKVTFLRFGPSTF